MKTVFSNSQVCHVWANGVQDYGRNSSDSIFFEGDTIYSYGYHYPMAKYYDPQSKKFMGHNYKKVYLINGNGYSPTTGQHTNHVLRAIDTEKHLYLYVDDINKPKETLLNKQKEIIDEFFKYFSSQNPYDPTDTDIWYDDRLDRFNEICDFFGFKYKLDFSKLEPARQYHFEDRENRKKELNTPEMIAKREAQKKRKKQLELEKAKKEQIESIQRFRNFESNRVFRLETDLLRVKDGVIQTSGGAEVPLTHGLRLLDLIETKKAKQGDRVGHFTLDNYDGKFVKIGCHKIEIEEARNVLSPYRNKALSIVKEVN
jgi:hypothetical protein